MTEAIKLLEELLEEERAAMYDGMSPSNQLSALTFCSGIEASIARLKKKSASMPIPAAGLSHVK